MDFTPKRIVSLQPSVTATLSSLGADGCLVACTKYCEEVVPGISQGRRVVADSWTSKATEILAAEPDLVIASVPYQLEAVAEILKAGVRFLGFAPKTLADIYSDIAILAGIVGKADAGEGVINGMHQVIDLVSSQLKQAKLRRRPHVFCEEWGKPIIASQPWVAEFVEIAGGEFVGEPGSQTTADEVLARDPDIVIAAWCGAGDRVPLERIVTQRDWQQMRAVRERQVYCIPDPHLNTPAPTVMAGLLGIAKIINPQLGAETPGIRRIGDALSTEASVLK
jgi:iron complex transport system substrate-binding protein